MSLLMWLFVIPFFSACVAFLLPITGKNLKKIAFVLSLIPLALLVYGFPDLIGSEVKYSWMPLLSIEFYLKVDSLSFLFLALTAVIIPISILPVHSSTLNMPNFFYGWVLLLEGLLIGFFTAHDLAIFTLFWEAMLIPLYFIMNVWGGPQRHQAAIKFLIYMIAGSFLMVAAILGLFLAAGTFNLETLQHVAAAGKYAPWICAVFLLAFAVKTPLFPFHAWLPDAYCQASTSGTILLSALLSKAGIYGILRIGMGLFPLIMKEWSPFLLGLSIAGVFYGGLAAWLQKDYKRLIAYSSFSHVNFILVALFVWNQTAEAGGILQALNHGVTIAALFLVAGWLEERIGTTAFGKESGLAKYMPQLCWLTLFFVLSSVALPGTNSFIGELMILFGLFVVNPWQVAFLALSVILSVIYMLRWMQLIYFQEPAPFQNRWVDIHKRELCIAFPLILLVLWIGIYPAPVLKLIQPSAIKMEKTQ